MLVIAAVTMAVMAALLRTRGAYSCNLTLLRLLFVGDDWSTVNASEYPGILLYEFEVLCSEV